MTDKEKIRAEVEKLYKEVTSDYSLEGVASAAQLHKILVFIDSLSEEPVSKDLEEAVRKAANWFSLIGGDEFFSNDYWFFKKGAQWQKEQMIDKACVWLEENAPFRVISHEWLWHKIHDFRKAMEKQL